MSSTTFDSTRTGTGTKEWAEITVNIQKGCANNCLYCYAADNAAKRYGGWRKREEWEREELSKKADIKSYPLQTGVVMFPSTHDITPFNVDAYIRVAKLILQKGNRLLIVSKPRISCIEKVLIELSEWKEQIQMRFTIGSVDEITCHWWEPGAPPPLERIMALSLAHDKGYQTSVSIEPMLGGIEGAIRVVEAVSAFVTETIWIGKMNKIQQRVFGGLRPEEIISRLEYAQRDSEIILLYNTLKHNPQVRWKDSIKKVVNG